MGNGWLIGLFRWVLPLLYSSFVESRRKSVCEYACAYDAYMRVDEYLFGELEPSADCLDYQVYSGPEKRKGNTRKEFRIECSGLVSSRLVSSFLFF